MIVVLAHSDRQIKHSAAAPYQCVSDWYCYCRTKCIKQMCSHPTNAQISNQVHTKRYITNLLYQCTSL